MELSVVASAPEKVANGCMIVPLHSGRKLAGMAEELDKKSQKAISRAVKRGDAKSELGEAVTLFELDNVNIERVILVGAEKAGDLTTSQYRLFCQAAAKSLSDNAAGTVVVHVSSKQFAATESTQWHVKELVQALIAQQYMFTLHERQEKAAPPACKKCIIVVSKAELSSAKKAAKIGKAVANGQAEARNLGNLAANICTPHYLAKRGQALAKKNPKLKTKILNEQQMEKLGMGAFLSVSRGSRQPAKLICMEYQGASSKSKPIVLLGKGVTFDTGGISIKPSASMDEMKFDMCGAASVFGAMQALCEISPSINVIGVVAAAENMPDGDASRPGDVVTTMSGQSVEILNTDAEGRLVLCDALTYIERYKPQAVIDIATLTGACVVALGKVASGVMGNDKDLTQALVQSGQQTGDLAWELPLFDEYQKQLDSNFADMANIGGSPAGAITAGCFLSRFAAEFKWAHLDIAGVAWQSGAGKGASGRPVPLLLNYLLSKA